MAQSKSATGKLSGMPVQGNALVLLGMTVVSMALGVGFASHLGMPVSAAITCAALIYVTFVVYHIAVVRGRKVAELEAEISKLWDALGAVGEPLGQKSGQGQLVRQAKAAPFAPGSPLARAMSRSSVTDSVASQSASMVSAKAPAPIKGEAHGFAKTAVVVGGTVTPGRDQVFTLEDETALARAMAETDEYEAGHQPSVKQPATDLSGQQSAPMSAPVSMPVPTTLAAAARTLDASTIHEMVKKLATETANATSPRAAPAQHVQQQQQIDSKSDPVTVTLGDANVITQPASNTVDGDAITESVRALRAVADAMRPTAEPNSAVERIYDLDPESASLGEVEAVAAQENHLSLLAEALSADRMEVMLEPILGLKDQATRHYEISVCLRSAEGALLDPDADRRSLGGTGILPLIDLAKLSRVAEVSRRLAERGKTGSVFAGFAGESLADDDFLNRFADVYQDRAGITEQLVVALAQEDVRVFAPGHWSMVKDLSGAGFRFALEHVTDLDMDFDALKSSNIQYVKLDAEVYLRGLPASDGVNIPAADVYKFLADKGLSLIVDHITSESQLMKIVDCGALYGQGRLFGGPRSVKAQVFSTRSAA